MANIDPKRLKEQLTLHEGYKRSPYKDSVGKLTIGIGHNLDDNGLPAPIIDALFLFDVEQVTAQLQRHLPWIFGLDEVRQRVLFDMCFNLGILKLLKFKNTLAAVRRGDYEVAADMMMDSLWATQVGDGPGGTYDRAERLATMMRTGQDYTR